MTPRFLLRLEALLQQIEHSFPVLFGPKQPPGKLTRTFVLTSKHFYRICLPSVGIVALVTPQSASLPIPSDIAAPYSLKDLIGDGFLWAVPKNRRTVEKRWKRKFGSPEYVLKILLPKTTLRVCNHCGHDFEVGLLCRKYCTRRHKMFPSINFPSHFQPTATTKFAKKRN